MARCVFVFVLAAGLCAAGAGLSPKKDPSPLDPKIIAIQTAAVAGVLPALRGIAASADGSATYLPSPDGLRLLQVNTQGHVSASLQFVNPISRVVISSDGKVLAALSQTGGSLGIVSTESFSISATLVSASPAGAVFSEDGASLYVATTSGVQVFDLASSNLAQAVNIAGSPSDIVLAGSQLVVATPELGQLSILDATNLDVQAAVPLAPGTCVVSAQGGMILAASPVADTLTFIDLATTTVIKTLALQDPDSLATLESFALVCREGVKVDTLETDRLSAEFGERRTLSMVSTGATLIASDLLGTVAVSTDRTKLVRISKDALSDRSHSDDLLPAKGVPGTVVLATGQYGAGPSAVFLRNETFEATRAAENPTDTSFDTEIPLETALGSVQLWVSRSSGQSIDTRTFVASSPISFEAIGTATAIDDLIIEIESTLANPNLSAEGKDFLTAALASLRNAKAHLNEGKLGQVLADLAGAFDALDQAVGASVPINGPRLTSVSIMQYAVFSKLAPVSKQLGEKDKDIKEANRLFEQARANFKSGKLRDGVNGFLATYDTLEEAIARARKLRAAQAVAIIRRVIGSLNELRNTGHDQMMHEHHHDSSNPYAAALLKIGKYNDLKGTVIGYLSKFQPLQAIGGARTAYAELAKEGQDAHDLQLMLCGTFTRMVHEIADAVEANVGPHDEAVARARKFLATCASLASSGDHAGALENLEYAMSDAPVASSLSKSAAQPSLELFQATYTDTTECHPGLEISKIQTVCVHSHANTIDPNPLRFFVQLFADVPDAYGVLMVSIKRKNGGQTVKTFIDRDVVAPSTQIYTWDGMGDNGQLVSFSGKAPQETLVVEAEFICYSSLGEPHSVKRHGEFNIVNDETGLIVEPGRVDKCASDDAHTSREQFRAYICKDGQPRTEVTNQCVWSLQNPEIGTIGADSGLFTAGQGKRGKSKVTAVLKSPPSRGHAMVTVTPEGGGIVEPSVNLCVNGTYDFTVVKGCDSNGDAIQQNDQQYTWFVTDAATGAASTKGTVSQDGFFRALEKGAVIVTAQGTEQSYTATVDINDIDSLEVVEAPFSLCPGDSGNFEVEAKCNAMPAANIPVAFTSTAPVSSDPVAAVTNGAGIATTLLSVPTGSAPGVSVAQASALGLTAIAQIVVEEVDEIVVLAAPSTLCVDDEGFQLLTVQALCHGIGRGGVLVTFTNSDGRVTFNPPSAVTFADGRISTRVIPTGIPSAAVGSTTLVASAGSASASTTITVYSISLTVDLPNAVCHDGSDTLEARATILPEGTATWTTPGLIIVNETESGTVSTVTLRGNNSGGAITTITASVDQTSNCSASADIDVVEVRTLAFDKPAICADGAETATATATILPLGRRSIHWSISARDGAIDTDINPTSGIITAGLQGGTITVRAADSDLLDCFIQGTYDVVKIRITAFPATLVAGQLETSIGDIFVATDPPMRGVNWTFVGDDLGALLIDVGAQDHVVINAQGATPGFVIVRAGDMQLPDCFDQVSIQILPAPPPPTGTEPTITILGVSDFIVPNSRLNTIRYSIIDPDIKFSSVSIEVRDKNGALVDVIPAYRTGSNQRVFWDGIIGSGPVSEAQSPYTYQVKGIISTGKTIVAEATARVEEHELALVLSDIAPTRKELSGKIQAETLLQLLVSVEADGFEGPDSSVRFAPEEALTKNGEEELLAYMIDVSGPYRFYTTPTTEATIRYTITAWQYDTHVRDLAGNPWDMNPDTSEFENQTTLRFDVNAKGEKSLTRGIDRTFRNTGSPIAPYPDPPPFPTTHVKE